MQRLPEEELERSGCIQETEKASESLKNRTGAEIENGHIIQGFTSPSGL